METLKVSCHPYALNLDVAEENELMTVNSLHLHTNKSAHCTSSIIKDEEVIVVEGSITISF